jgi:hypothetical protein
MLINIRLRIDRNDLRNDIKGSHESIKKTASLTPHPTQEPASEQIYDTEI